MASFHASSAAGCFRREIDSARVQSSNILLFSARNQVTTRTNKGTSAGITDVNMENKQLTFRLHQGQRAWRRMVGGSEVQQGSCLLKHHHSQIYK